MKKNVSVLWSGDSLSEVEMLNALVSSTAKTLKTEMEERNTTSLNLRVVGVFTYEEAGSYDTKPGVTLLTSDGGSYRTTSSTLVSAVEAVFSAVGEALDSVDIVVMTVDSNKIGGKRYYTLRVSALNPSGSEDR